MLNEELFDAAMTGLWSTTLVLAAVSLCSAIISEITS